VSAVLVLGEDFVLKPEVFVLLNQMLFIFLRADLTKRSF